MKLPISQRQGYYTEYIYRSYRSIIVKEQNWTTGNSQKERKMINQHNCCLVTKSSDSIAIPWTVVHQPPLSMGFDKRYLMILLTKKQTKYSIHHLLNW